MTKPTNHGAAEMPAWVPVAWAWPKTESKGKGPIAMFDSTPWVVGEAPVDQLEALLADDEL